MKLIIEIPRDVPLMAIKEALHRLGLTCRYRGGALVATSRDGRRPLAVLEPVPHGEGVGSNA